MKKIIPLLIALVAILFLWIFFSKEEPLTGEFYKAPLPEKFIKSSYYSEYNLENKFVIYVDFAKSAKKRRLWVVDKGVVLATSYTSHGKKSAAFTNFLAPRSFSNEIGSNQSSLGIYRIYPERRMNPGKIHSCTCQKYLQEKKCAHNARKFPINGLVESNNNAIERGVVIHTARYVSEKGCTGNSDGCFVVSPEIFELLQHKRLLFLKKCYLVAIQ
ncbi:MAG: murein L,D-transpeptidase catalytic domain-containing protein [Flavobacteriales bacterium]|jgi:hypothetical protein